MYILYTVRHSDAAMTVFKFLINYIDVDECGVNNGGCDHDCVKTTAGAQECRVIQDTCCTQTAKGVCMSSAKRTSSES